MSSNGLSYLSNQSLLSRIEFLNKSIKDLYIENKIYFNDDISEWEEFEIPQEESYDDY